MLSFNRRFVELWDLPPDVVASRSNAAALEAIETRLAEPQEFYDRVAYLYAHPDEKSREEIELVDGRILERYSSPVTSAEGELFGRVWFFRDITELRRGQEIATVLAAASDLLASTSEIEAVLQLVVRLPVPRLVGICTLYLLDEEGVPRLAAVAHRDPEQEESVRELHRRFPIGEEGPIMKALRTKESCSPRASRPGSAPAVGKERGASEHHAAVREQGCDDGAARRARAHVRRPRRGHGSDGARL